MPLYPPGFNPNAVDVQAIAAEMRPALEQWFSGHIQIIDPNTRGGEPYDAKTDTGGVADPDVVLDSGPGGALIQALSGARTGDQGDQQIGIQGVRFQVKASAMPAGVQLHSGLQVIVVDGGNDPQLTMLTYSLKRAINSSIMWNEIFEAVVATAGRA